MKHLLSLAFYFIFCISLFAQLPLTNTQVADSLYDLGEYEKSKATYELVLSTSISKNSQNSFYCKTQIAECEIRLNNLEEAQRILTDALALCPANFVTEQALVENALAKVYYQKGQLDLATNQIQHAILILKKSPTVDEAALSDCYNTQGLIDWIAGNDEKGLEYLEQSLGLRRKIFGEQSSEVAAIYNNLGLVYSGIDLDQSLMYYKKAMDIYENIYPSKHPARAIAYSNLGQIYRKEKSYNTALIQYEKALAIWEERYPKVHPNKAFVNSSIAQVLQDKKEFELALEIAEKANAMYIEVYGEKHPNTAACYTLIAGIYSDKKDYSKALIAIQKSLISNCNSFSSTDYTLNPTIDEYFDGKLLLSALTLKAIVLSKREAEKTLRIKDLTLALDTYQSCDTLLDKLRQTRTSKNDKVALGIYSYEIYEKSIELCFMLSENTLRKQYYLKRAFYYVERSKASVLQESIAESKAKVFAGIPNVKIQEEDDFKATINYLEQKLAKGISDAENMKNTSNQLFDVKRKYEFFIQSLEIDYPDYYNLKYNVQSIQIETLQSQLAATDCILEYFISEATNKLIIFRITSNSYDVFFKPLKNTYEKYISGLRNSIKFENKELFITTSQSLYQQLIPSLPKKCQHIIVIPDGKMAAIPFETLISSRPKADTSEYATFDFLIKKYSVSYTFASSLFKKALNQTDSKSILLFAPVDFSASSELSSLPGTLIEVDSIHRLFYALGKSKLITHSSATTEVLTNDSISNYSIIHLATHGLVDEEQPELSCIYTYGTTEENDRIYSGNIYNLHLNANLVTLSACQTGLGKIAKGEGLIGLSRAFIYAGANTINVSLWKVSDLSTQVYMNTFYNAYLSGQCKTFAESSREAKLKLLHSTLFKNPYYWSAFILIGE